MTRHEMTNLIGQRVRTTKEHSEPGVIVKPGKASLPMPGPDWFIIKFDLDGKKLCIHRSSFTVCNS